jgi:hypothetical protein
MEYIVTYATGTYSKLSKISPETQILNFGLHIIRTLHVSKEMRIHCYFLMPKGAASKKV